MSKLTYSMLLFIVKWSPKQHRLY